MFNIVVPRLHLIYVYKVCKSIEVYYEKSYLRKLYPDVYKTDIFIEVTDDVKMVFKAYERSEEAYNRKKY